MWTQGPGWPGLGIIPELQVELFHWKHLDLRRMGGRDIVPQRKTIVLSFLKNLFIYFNWRLITLQYCGGFGHKFTWISYGCTCVPHPDLPYLFPPHPIPQGHPAVSTLPHALNLDWRSISHMIIYMFLLCNHWFASSQLLFLVVELMNTSAQLLFLSAIILIS